jgi:hypothetical protein
LVVRFRSQAQHAGHHAFDHFVFDEADVVFAGRRFERTVERDGDELGESALLAFRVLGRQTFKRLVDARLVKDEIVAVNREDVFARLRVIDPQLLFRFLRVGLVKQLAVFGIGDANLSVGPFKDHLGLEALQILMGLLHFVENAG